MSTETEIARHLYDKVRSSPPAREAVRLPVDMDHVQRLWPAATREEILRAYLIAYELLVLEAAEARAAKDAAALPLPVRDRRGQD